MLREVYENTALPVYRFDTHKYKQTNVSFAVYLGFIRRRRAIG